MTTPARQHTIREHNLTLVMRLVADGPLRSRAQLAEASGLTRATVSALVDGLIDNDLLIELNPNRSTRGRPGSPVTLNPNGPSGLGIEINVDYVSACIVDLTGQVRAECTTVADNRAVSPSVALRRALALAAKVRAEAGGPDIAGATVALPGLVDTDGVLSRAPNLQRWQGIDIIGPLAEALELPVQVDNEANLAALAELWFTEQPASDFVLVSGEIGVGAGIILDRRLYRGVRGRAGELGHVVIDPAGPPCGCGSNGCLEQFAGQEAVLRSAGVIASANSLSGTSIGDPDGGIAELRRRATARDPLALQAMASAGSALGIALSGLVNLLDIPTIVLGGIYASLGQWLVGPIADELERRVLNPSATPIDLRVSTLSFGAAVRGAAGLVVHRLIDRPNLATGR